VRPFLICLLLSGVANANTVVRPFPLPSPDGKAVAAAADQRTFRIPFRFNRVEQFYRDRFKGDPKVTLLATFEDGRHVLTLRSARSDDAWAKAVIHEGEVETRVDVTPVLRAGEERVEGSGRPLVEMVLTRSQDFDRMVNSIDHTSDGAH
jgi:hypothetical protein